MLQILELTHIFLVFSGIMISGFEEVRRYLKFMNLIHLLSLDLKACGFINHHKFSADPKKKKREEQSLV